MVSCAQGPTAHPLVQAKPISTKNAMGADGQRLRFNNAKKIKTSVEFHTVQCTLTCFHKNISKQAYEPNHHLEGVVNTFQV